jgi:hypothetical protein
MTCAAVKAHGASLWRDWKRCYFLSFETDGCCHLHSRESFSLRQNIFVLGGYIKDTHEHLSPTKSLKLIISGKQSLVSVAFKLRDLAIVFFLMW